MVCGSFESTIKGCVKKSKLSYLATYTVIAYECLSLYLGCVHTSRVESSPIQSSQALESRGVHTDRVESKRVSANPSGFLVLFEQCTSKEL